ncbi:MAG TPA: PilZ domain-containing protein [Candidatus Sulfotelmatobacter sp.]|nr:PilZ domain-containing protein [Candidatus Sulfotelmatobacter sp.]
MPDSAEKRRSARRQLFEPATILLGSATSEFPPGVVFAETVDVSDGGACLRTPRLFSATAGDAFHVSSFHIGDTRAARVVHAGESTLRVAFGDL